MSSRAREALRLMIYSMLVPRAVDIECSSLLRLAQSFD